MVREESTTIHMYNSLHVARKYATIFVHGHYLVREVNSCPGTVRFEEQIISMDKYPSIFSHHMGAIVFFIRQIFFATSTVLKTGDYSKIFVLG